MFQPQLYKDKLHMIKKQLGITILIAGMGISTASFSDGKTHWAYSGQEGPEHWGSLDSDFITCSTGKNQSPVNLIRMTKGYLPHIKVNYSTGGNEILNNGHTIQVNYASGSSIKVGKHEFELKQFNFHSPSENTIEGHSYPMEAHFVHADKAGNLAVVAVMFAQGNYNAELEKAWSQMPANKGDKQVLRHQVDANRLLPRRHDYIRYNGSLTTPPCSEGVTWIVMEDIESASIEQIQHFRQVMQHPNNRPVQPVNARLIIK